MPITSIKRRVALVGASLLALANVPAHAAVNLDAITGAQADALSVAGALLAMGIAVWGAMFLYRKFFK